MLVAERCRACFAQASVSKANLLREAGRTTPSLRAVDGGVDANSHRAIGADIILVGTVLAALGGDALQLLLGRSIGVADLHQVALVTNGLAMVALDDLLTHLTGLEAVVEILVDGLNPGRLVGLPSKTDATGVAHAVTQDLARHDLVRIEDGDELLD